MKGIKTGYSLICGVMPIYNGKQVKVLFQEILDLV